jgi:cell division control protein 45
MVSRNIQHQKMLDKINQDKHLENLNNCLHDNFWIAYDALDPKNAGIILVRGIELAKEMQQAVIRVGTSIIERKEVKVAEYFRYVMLENDYL